MHNRYDSIAVVSNQDTEMDNRLAGPVLFRGRLRAFGKCTNGVAFSKGRPNLASVRLTL